MQRSEHKLFGSFCFSSTQPDLNPQANDIIVLTFSSSAREGRKEEVQRICARVSRCGRGLVCMSKTLQYMTSIPHRPREMRSNTVTQLSDQTNWLWNCVYVRVIRLHFFPIMHV